MQSNTNTLIIGASAAGLACAARLVNKEIPFKIIERHQYVGHAWRHHYDRLHLHTNKGSSHLPYIKFPRQVPQYPSRKEVVEYLDNYWRKLGIKPIFNTSAVQVHRESGGWVTSTGNQDMVSENLIICTGNTNVPRRISKPGLDTFPGPVLHSSEYTNGKMFKDKKVLVIGFGNSACEIAICLHEHGALPAMSVRSPVNVIPRDILGIPVLKLGILFSRLRPEIADQLNKPLMNLLVGNIEKYGLNKLPYGPMEQIARDHSIPLLDIGTMQLIKQEKVRVFGDIIAINGPEVQFHNSAETFDAIIMATGYHPGLHRFIDLPPERLKDIQLKIGKRAYFGNDNLYFCGYFVSPSGMLREINQESGYIADDISKHYKASHNGSK